MLTELKLNNNFFIITVITDLKTVTYLAWQIFTEEDRNFCFCIRNMKMINETGLNRPIIF